MVITEGLTPDNSDYRESTKRCFKRSRILIHNLPNDQVPNTTTANHRLTPSNEPNPMSVARTIVATVAQREITLPRFIASPRKRTIIPLLGSPLHHRGGVHTGVGAVLTLPADGAHRAVSAMPTTPMNTGNNTSIEYRRRWMRPFIHGIRTARTISCTHPSSRSLWKGTIEPRRYVLRFFRRRKRPIPVPFQSPKLFVRAICQPHLQSVRVLRWERNDYERDEEIPDDHRHAVHESLSVGYSQLGKFIWRCEANYDIRDSLVTLTLRSSDSR